MKLGLIQMKVVNNKAENLKRAEKFIKSASMNGARIVVLPEMFNCPYDNSYFRAYAEGLEGETVRQLSNWAKESKIILIGGSIPEVDENFIYNTSYIFDENGVLIGKHRKVHLFDIDIKNKIKFTESEVLSSGNKSTVISTTYGKIGVCICYDIRFPELARKMVLEGAELILVPGAFNMITGPAHWELTARARALDNQVYYGLCSPARNEGDHYQVYGHSLITNPWGDVIGQLDEEEGVLIKDIDMDFEREVRDQLPLLKHRKSECY